MTSALGQDSRIGRKYLRGALGYGGTCFPRDNIAFSYLLENLGVCAGLPRAVDQVNRRVAQRVADMAQGALGEKDRRVGILGLAYKPSTNVVEESQGVEIARRLAAKGIEVLVYDPVAMEEARKVLKDSVSYAESVGQCLRQVSVLVIATPWPEFESVARQRGKLHPKQTIIDGWRLCSTRPPGDYYTGVGVGKPEADAAARLQELIQQILTPDAQFEPRKKQEKFRVA